MNIIKEFLSVHGVEILYAIVAFIATYLGAVVKNVVTKYFNNKTKKEIARTVVGAVEQIYKNLHGDDKLNEALKAASEMLAAEGITVTDVELRYLIESAVSEFNKTFNKTTDNKTK